MAIATGTITINFDCAPPPAGLLARDDVATVTEPGVAIYSVLLNDTFTPPIQIHDGAPVPAALTFDKVTGEVSVNPDAAPGTYTFTYWLCPAGILASMDDCSMAHVTVTYAPYEVPENCHRPAHAPTSCYRVAQAPTGCYRSGDAL